MRTPLSAMLLAGLLIAAGCGDSETTGDAGDDALDDRPPDTAPDAVDDPLPDIIPDPSSEDAAAEDGAGDLPTDTAPDTDAADIPSEEEPATARLVHEGIISSLHVSPTEDAVFFFYNDWGWSSGGGYLATASSSGLVADLGMESYTVGMILNDNVGGRRLLYYMELAPDADTPLAMADMTSVRQLSFCGNNSCLNVEREDGFAAFVDTYMVEPEEFYVKGPVKIVRPGSSAAEGIGGTGACGVDEYDMIELVSAVSPDRAWFAYYDYSWHMPEWPDIELTIIRISPSISDTPAMVSMLYNHPRAAPVFTPDSSKLVYLDQNNMVAFYPVSDPDGASRFEYGTYPHLAFKVMSNTEVLFPAENESEETDIAAGNMETGVVRILGSPHGWGRIIPSGTAGYTYVDFGLNGLYWLDLSDGAFTLVEEDAIHWGRSWDGLKVHGDRVVYVTGNSTDGYELKTADPLHGESARTIVSDYSAYLRFDFDDLFQITSDGRAVLYIHSTEKALKRTAIETGDTATLASPDVIMYRYIRASDRIAFVRGKNGGTADPGEGLYLLP